jgi:hypothetical protein
MQTISTISTTGSGDPQGCDFTAPELHWGCQPDVLATLLALGRVLVSTLQLEGLGKLKKSNGLIEIRTCSLPTCSTVQQCTLRHAPVNMPL